MGAVTGSECLGPELYALVEATRLLVKKKVQFKGDPGKRFSRWTSAELAVYRALKKFEASRG